MGIRNVELKSTANRSGGMNQITAAAAPCALWLLVIFTLLTPVATAIPSGDPPAPYNCWLESGLSSLFDQVSPSVVRVVSHRKQSPPVGNGSSSNLIHHRLVASGVVVGPLGSVVTSARVAQPGDSISVHFPDGRTLIADYRGIDPLLNIVVLSLRSDNNDFPYLVHNNATGADLPEWVAAVAYGPVAGLYGGAPTLTLSSREAVEVLQTQYADSLSTIWRIRAPFYPGNAGGALVGLDGEWLGLITGIISDGSPSGSSSDARQGTAPQQAGVIVPAGVIASAISDIITGTRETIGFLGVATYQSDAEDTSGDPGVLVTEVLADSPADRSGIKTGDRIIRFNGVAINTPSRLTDELSVLAPGHLIRLEVSRSGKELLMRLFLGDSNAADLYLNRQRQRTTERRLIEREIVRLEKKVLLLRNRLFTYGSTRSYLREESYPSR